MQVGKNHRLVLAGVILVTLAVVLSTGTII